jgi:L-asparagine oxygenase
MLGQPVEILLRRGNEDRIHSSCDSTMSSEWLKQGWTETCVPYHVDLLSFASQFGSPVAARRNGPLIDRLTPKLEMEARPNSMSAQHGLETFPYHTDGASFQIPPRLVFLRLAYGATSHTNTNLLSVKDLPFSDSDLQSLTREIWVVHGKYPHFYSSILSRGHGANAWRTRYDPCCMRPALPRTSKSQCLFENAIHIQRPHAIRWIPEKTIIIDNWRVLHSRESVAPQDKSCRILERVLVSPSIEE